jgi:predicted RNA-binding Zn-ribbon protein involved in translation (DUF1610 family)
MVIRTNCPACGDVSVRPKDIRLELIGGDEETGGRYAFACPTCGRTALGQAEPAAVRTLKAAGAACVIELRPDASLPALTYDDLLDFCTEDLASDYVVERMQRALGMSSHPAATRAPVAHHPVTGDGRTTNG